MCTRTSTHMHMDVHTHGHRYLPTFSLFAATVPVQADSGSHVDSRSGLLRVRSGITEGGSPFRGAPWTARGSVSFRGPTEAFGRHHSQW